MLVAVQRPYWRKVCAHSFANDLEHPLGSVDVTEVVFTEIGQCMFRRRCEGRRRRADEHLSAVSGRHDPGTEVECRPEVVTAPLDRITGMDPHSHEYRNIGRPRLCGQSLLRFDRCVDGIARSGKRCSERIAGR